MSKSKWLHLCKRQFNKLTFCHSSQSFLNFFYFPERLKSYKSGAQVHQQESSALTCSQYPRLVMSRSATVPLGAGGATAPDTLTLLHRRLLLAEEEAEGLIRDVGMLGVSPDDILGSRGAPSPPELRRVLGDESMLWRHCDSLVSRVCRMESLLQTLKLTIFRLETERELDPPHTGNGLCVILSTH